MTKKPDEDAEDPDLRATIESLRRSSADAARRAGLTEEELVRLINREIARIPPRGKKGGRRQFWVDPSGILCVLGPGDL